MVELIRVDEFKKKSKRRYILHIVFICLLLVLTITGSVLSLLLSSLDYLVNLILNISIDAIVIVFTIFYFLNVFPVVKHYYSYFKNMNDISLEHRRNMTFFKEIEHRDISNVDYRVLQFTYQEGEKQFNENLYILDSNEQFTEGKSYRIDTYHNVIIKYEVL